MTERPFNANAVKVSFERVINKDHPFYKYGSWKYPALGLGPVKEVKVIDDYTVALRTEKPYAPLVANLALWLCPILSPAAIEKYKEDIGRNPVGTGPFKFVRWIKDDQIILERNDNYWGQKPQSGPDHSEIDPGGFRPLHGPSIRGRRYCGRSRSGFHSDGQSAIRISR